MDKLKQLAFWRYLALGLSTALVLGSLLTLSLRGLPLGQDFTGGMVQEVALAQPIGAQELTQLLTPILKEKPQVVRNDDGWRIRYRADPGPGFSLAKALEAKLGSPVRLKSSSYLYSQVGDDQAAQSVLALLLAALAILGYLAWRFEWRLASGALLALAHDLLLVLGVFSLLGLEFDLSVLAALLAVMGYSVNDSIVVADRLRETLGRHPKVATATLVDRAVRATFSRTLVTSGTTLFTVGAILWLGGAALFGFALALLVGIVVGTWSSIFVAATLGELFGLKAEHYAPKPRESKEGERQSALPY
ncbi:protein translocase subunit SecF [Gallaecimonas kandeliae]|uniref:protein translocase subunit SecF n=1 Tax=Gallaecimonas kandeliae TaxID=3029055 RepID=UPI002648D62A|nr:protein translocase subunit SecF [Gallaecimonas kandeliae]WKE67029.1 protein translocase subunit SecF [Gallaecimonas kandeliae]